MAKKNNIHQLFPVPPSADEDISVQAIRDLDQVADAAHAAISGVLTLNRLTNNPIEAVGRAAQTAQATVQRMIAPPRRTERANTAAGGHNRDLVPSALFIWGRKLDRHLAHARRRGHRPHAKLTRLLGPVWTWLGLGVTVGAASLIVTHHWYLAAGLIVLRVVLSRRLGNETDLPYEGPTRDRRPRTMYRCIAAHLCDAIMLTAITWTLLASGATAWGFTGTIALAIMLLGTLSRVAAIQVGVQIFRLTLERIFRTATLVAALLLTGLFQPDLTASSPYLALAVLGPLLYGLGELLRTQLRLQHASRTYGASPAVHITVTGQNQSTRELVRTGFREAS